MSMLTPMAKKSIPAKKFGMPKQRKYPMPDIEHATKAKARATQQFKKGNLSEEMKDHIHRMADTITGKEG